jgi:hypothetical protein
MAILPNLPLTQIKLTKEGAPDLTLGPADLPDYFTACSLEYARRQPIDDEVFKKLAGKLGTEPTDVFRYEIYSLVIGTVLMVVRRFHSPRSLTELFENLKRDPLKTIEASRGNSFAEFAVSNIQQQVAETTLPEKAVIDWNIEAVSEAISPGRPDEEARKIFFEAVIATAQKYKIKLALPPRDDSRGMKTTPLSEFALAMRDLVAGYGNTMLAQQRLPLGRFDGFTKLDREQLIYHLEAARRTILREKPMLYT